MPTKTITYTDVLSVLECGNCHISFAIPKDMLATRQADGRDFWCPNGCKIHYFDNENKKLKADLAREKRNREWAETRARAAQDQADTAEYRRRAAKGQLTKVRNRISNGVCPCCNRSFADLARHMATKHPGYRDGD